MSITIHEMKGIEEATNAIMNKDFTFHISSTIDGDYYPIYSEGVDFKLEEQILETTTINNAHLGSDYTNSGVSKWSFSFEIMCYENDEANKLLDSSLFSRYHQRKGRVLWVRIGYGKPSKTETGDKSIPILYGKFLIKSKDLSFKKEEIFKYKVECQGLQELYQGLLFQ